MTVVIGVCRVQDRAAQLSTNEVNFMVPKLHDMMKHELTIPRLGSAGITSTAWGEAAHKHLKAAVVYTNQHADTRETQVIIMPQRDFLSGHPSAVSAFCIPFCACNGLVDVQRSFHARQNHVVAVYCRAGCIHESLQDPDSHNIEIPHACHGQQCWLSRIWCL